MLDINAAGISACQITNQFFIGRKMLKRIFGENFEQHLGFWT